MKSAFTFIFLIGMGINISCHAQYLPIEPEITVPLSVPDSFPAAEFKVKQLRQYDHNQLTYSAQYDNKGRIVRLEDYVHDSLRPNITTWNYGPGQDIRKKTVVPPCSACTRSTIIEEQWLYKNNLSYFSRIVRIPTKAGVMIDSLFVVKDSKDYCLDSAMFRNKELIYREVQTLYNNSHLKKIKVTDNRAEIDYLLEEKEYVYDTTGRLLQFIMKRGGHMITTESYTYNSDGNRISFEQTDATGSVTYKEQISYNEKGLPCKRTLSNSSGLEQVIEIWNYDTQGRLILNARPNQSPFVADSSFLYVRFLNHTNNDRVEIKIAGNNVTKTDVRSQGRMVTVTKSSYGRSGPRLPRPTKDMEDDSLFRIESIEEFDTVLEVLIRKINFERDKKKEHKKTSEYVYTYDEEGNVLQEEKWFWTKGQLKQHYITVFKYDSFDRLTQLTVYKDTGKVHSYSIRSYDGQGHLTLLDSCENNRYLRDSFAYDSLGRMLVAIHKSAFGKIDTITYTYSCDKIMSKVESSSTGYFRDSHVQYTPSCLPSTYIDKQKDGVVIRNVRWEFEFFQ